MHASLLPRLTSRFLAALFLVLPIAAQAQYSSTDGLFLHVRTGGHGVAFEDAGDDTGSTLGLRAGYGFSDLFTLYLGFEGGSLGGESRLRGLDTDETSGLAYVDLGGRFHFRRGSRLVPYADAAISVIGLGADAPGDDVSYGGAGFSVGGGALYFLSPTVALEGGATFTPGSLMESEIGGIDDDISLGIAGVRMHVGLTFYPFR